MPANRLFQTIRIGEPSRRNIVLTSMSRTQEDSMRDIILWIAGVPLVVIVGLHLTGFLH